MLKFVSRMVEYIKGKEENAGYRQFLLFLQCFQKASFSELSNFWIFGQWLICLFLVRHLVNI